MQLSVQHTQHEKAFKDLLLLAPQICGTPIAAIHLFGEPDSIFLEEEHLFLEDLLNDDTFSNYYQSQPGILIIPDLATSELFCDTSNAVYYPSAQFYAGVPLVTENDVMIGHLCVMGRLGLSFSEQQQNGLILLAKQVEALFNLQAKVHQLEKDREEIQNSEELMKSIFQNASDAVIVMDEKGIILQWNPMAQTIFGWTADEIIGRSLVDNIICEKSYNAYLKLIIQIRGENPADHVNQTIEILGYRSDHTEVDIALGVSSATMHGRLFYICVMSDITERKLTAKKLDTQKAFYEVILNKLPIDIAVFDTDHKYMFVNPGAISVEEYRKFIIGKDDYEYAAYRNRDISFADTRRANFLQVKNTGKEIRWEDTMPDPNGNMITHVRRLYPVHDEKGNLTMVIGYGIDITERKVLEEKQEVLVQQLSVQNTQLVDFCNIVSHNLRAPLVNISMLTDFIMECDDPEEQKILASKLNPVVSNLHVTFNELVESIQVKYDLAIRSEEINLYECGQRAIDTLETEINNFGATVTFEFEAAPVISYPAKYLHSIVYNLISNSLKYHSPGKPPEIVLATRVEKNSVILSVSDNGLGIDMEKHRNNVFKIGKVFHRHPDSKGFGLFMTKTQVEAMGGKIWVESSPGNGATFFIEFTGQQACNER